MKTIVAAAALVVSVLQPLRLTAQDASLASRTKGSASAPVTVYEMADFQCPVCRDFDSRTFTQIDREYIKTGKVKWIYIMFPLTSIHANAQASAEFAACASKQGKFWEAHDQLYGTQDKWEKLKDPTPFFASLIPAVGVKKDVLTACLTSGTGRNMVKDDAAGAERSGANATPTFYVEGGLMVGNQPIEVFRHVLDSIYIVKKGAKK